MKYAIDRVEEQIAVCENIETNEKIEISIALLPKGIHEGSIIKIENNKYNLDLDEEQERLSRIREKMERLKNISKK